MIETLIMIDFRLTIRTIQQLTPQASSFYKACVENLDEVEDTLIQKVHFEFKLLEKDRKFLELRSPSDDEFTRISYLGHIRFNSDSKAGDGRKFC